MREVYRIRREIIIDIPTRQFSDNLDIVPSIAGLHVTALARTASAGDISAAVQKASQAGIEVRICRRLLWLLQARRQCTGIRGDSHGQNQRRSAPPAWLLSPA